MATKLLRDGTGCKLYALIAQQHMGDLASASSWATAPDLKNLILKGFGRASGRVLRPPEERLEPGWPRLVSAEPLVAGLATDAEALAQLAHVRVGLVSRRVTHVPVRLSPISPNHELFALGGGGKNLYRPTKNRNWTAWPALPNNLSWSCHRSTTWRLQPTSSKGYLYAFLFPRDPGMCPNAILAGRRQPRHGGIAGGYFSV